MAGAYTKQHIKGKEEPTRTVIFFGMDRESEAAAADLRRLISECGGEIIMTCSWQQTEVLEDLKNRFHAHQFDGPSADTTPQDRRETIRGYLAEHSDVKSYLVLDSFDMEPYFRGHAIQTGEKGLSEELMKKACRILQFGPWWEPHYGKQFPYSFYRSDTLIEDYYTKVIFLDIDGVLNDEDTGYSWEKQEERGYIDPEFVKNLSWIVDETGAEIVLSSSWRNAYFRDARNNFEHTGEELKELFENLDYYHLKIPGMTPRYFNGPYGRPFEIRAWLCCRPYVESFVILDDDTFWQWNWLESNFVCTRHEVPREDGRYSSPYIKGLDRGFAEQAVRILEKH